jgi:hypothetical protein
VKVFAILAYAVSATVPYLHVAAISVASESVAPVVPAANVPEGAPFEASGAFDGTAIVVVETLELCELALYIASKAETAYEYNVPFESPVSEYDVPVVVATGLPPPLRYIR